MNFLLNLDAKSLVWTLRDRDAGGQWKDFLEATRFQSRTCV
jgi:hypothetical protein